MDEVNEWEVLAEEGNADDQNTVEDNPPTFETIRILFQMTTAKVLGEIAKKLDVTLNGPKRKLFDWIRDSDHVEKVDNDSFDYHCQIVKGEKVPTWIILNPEPAAAVPGVDMATGVQFEFYGPTIKENAVGGEHHNFATIEADRIQRPKFEAKKKERADRKNNTAPANNHGGPSPAAWKRIPKLKVACPKDVFNLQITPEFVQRMTNASTAVLLPMWPGLAPGSSRIGSLLMTQKFTGSLVFSLQTALRQNPELITSLSWLKCLLCLGMTSFPEPWQRRCPLLGRGIKGYANGDISGGFLQWQIILEGLYAHRQAE